MPTSPAPNAGAAMEPGISAAVSAVAAPTKEEEPAGEPEEPAKEPEEKKPG